ncbi:MAG: hypothetical protein ACPL7D_07080 [Candidatus Sumerlaeaceae bacterium]
MNRFEARKPCLMTPVSDEDSGVALGATFLPQVAENILPTVQL